MKLVVVYNSLLKTVPGIRTAVERESSRHDGVKLTWHEYTPRLSAKLIRAVHSADRVLVVGGDGIVRDIAALVVGTPVQLAILPSGTGNLLARNVHLPINDVRRAVRVAFTGKPALIDSATLSLEGPSGASEHFFLVMAGIGLDADMATGVSYQHKRRFGWLAYVAPIVRSILRNTQHEMSLQLDDRKPVAIRAHTAIIGNCGTLTANMLLLPDALLSDGKLDVVVLNPKGLPTWTRIWTRVSLAGPMSMSKPGRQLYKVAPPISALQYGQFTKLELRLHSPQAVQIDGDVIGDASFLRVSVMPKSLYVVVPI